MTSPARPRRAADDVSVHHAPVRPPSRQGPSEHPDDPALLTEQADTAMAQGRHADAERHLRAALARSPLKGPYVSHRHRRLGEVLLCRTRPAAAAVVLRRAVVLDPFNAAVYTALAEALEALRRFDEAITARRSRPA
ncbi:tetratricopeptide repeat protein [Streptomyces sp. NPDC087532]|uniref:tetratricopeptide repeat protein n=1 Tax=Streptomyces sp. NPDC087532 TaxID=3365795 RepID=UPI003803AEA7